MDGHTVYKDGHSWGCDYDSVAAGPAFFTSLVSYPHFNVLNLQNTSSCISDRRIGSHVSGTDQSSSRRPVVQPQNVITKFTCAQKKTKTSAYSHLQVHSRQPSHSRCPTGTRPGRACHPACRTRSGSSRCRTAPRRRRSRSCSCMHMPITLVNHLYEGGDREASTYWKPEVTLNARGGMRLMSVEEPEPGAVGFTSVVSTSVQPSPLNPHLPCRQKR